MQAYCCDMYVATKPDHRTGPHAHHKIVQSRCNVKKCKASTCVAESYFANIILAFSKQFSEFSNVDCPQTGSAYQDAQCDYYLYLI